MEDELNQLIDKYHKYIDCINGVNEFDVFCGFYAKVKTTIIEPWINTKFNKTSIKCQKKAKQFREDGNTHFKTGCWVPAILSYNKSIIYSPFDSLEFNLAVGNRSATLYHLGKYEACIKDLDLCLDILTYPKNKKYKLYLRLIQSCIDLNLTLKAKQSYRNFLDYLDNIKDEFDEVELRKFRQNAENLNELIDLTDENHKTKPFVPFLEVENPKFQNASDRLTIKFDVSKGRYVEATRDIRPGDVLFIEKTLCFVPIVPEDDPKCYKNVCYHCFQDMWAPIPCDNCDEVFCSLECKSTGWTSYHRFECLGSCSQIWKNIGVNFLAFRIFLFGFQNQLFNFKLETDNVEIFEVVSIGAIWYKRVCSLLTNIEWMKPVDILPHLVSTLILISYLKDKTHFFRELRQKYPEYSEKNDEELVPVIGALLLKHILQVICNASIIENVRDDFYDKFNKDVELNESGMFVQGTGLFPSVSLMNHSCDSNVTNYFIQDTIVVKANRHIRKGEEILNCYGHDCRSESTLERKKSLKFQYYFECSCSACAFPSRPEMYENGLLCPECNNCALNQTPGIKRAKCLQCNHEFNTEEHLKVLATSDRLYKKWQMTKNIKYLEQCHEIEEKIYFKYNYKIYDLIQDLQTYYKNAERFPEWWTHTKTLLDLDNKVYGGCSLKYGLNLRHTLITLTKFLSRKFLPKSLQEEMLKEVQEMLRVSRNIFDLYYPKNKLKFNCIDLYLSKLK